jgi:hypothetical protein
MELPINRPSQMFYADEVDFNGLLGKLKSERFNGFIRVTSGSGEGYILFNEGKQRASSFEDYSKVEALEEIKSIVKDSKTFIEVFDIKKSQMDYIMELNKFFIIDSDLSVDDIVDELKKTEKIPAPVEEVKENPGAISSSVTETHESIKDSLEQVDKQESLNIPEDVEKISRKDEEPEIDGSKHQKENEFIEPGAEGENVDRDELMKKYGLKDISEEEAGNILETYKGGSLSDDDVEKIELTLMNKIKKSILGIPKIRGSEVMVFLDNTSKVSGTVNIITEYEGQGLLSRIMGESRDLENLRKQIINITQMEVKKSFREYPEIVDDFIINVEIR